MSDVRGFCFDSFSFCYKKIISVVAVDLILDVVVALVVTEVLVVGAASAASAAVAVAVVVKAPILITFEAVAAAGT